MVVFYYFNPQLARLGIDVVLISRSLDKLKKVALEIGNLNIFYILQIKILSILYCLDLEIEYN